MTFLNRYNRYMSERGARVTFLNRYKGVKELAQRQFRLGELFVRVVFSLIVDGNERKRRHPTVEGQLQNDIQDHKEDIQDQNDTQDHKEDIQDQNDTQDHKEDIQDQNDIQDRIDMTLSNKKEAREVGLAYMDICVCMCVCVCVCVFC